MLDFGLLNRRHVVWYHWGGFVLLARHGRPLFLVCRHGQLQGIMHCTRTSSIGSQPWNCNSKSGTQALGFRGRLSGLQLALLCRLLFLTLRKLSIQMKLLVFARMPCYRMLDTNETMARCHFPLVKGPSTPTSSGSSTLASWTPSYSLKRDLEYFAYDASWVPKYARTGCKCHAGGTVTSRTILTSQY